MVQQFCNRFIPALLFAAFPTVTFADAVTVLSTGFTRGLSYRDNGSWQWVRSARGHHAGARSDLMRRLC